MSADGNPVRRKRATAPSAVRPTSLKPKPARRVRPVIWLAYAMLGGLATSGLVRFMDDGASVQYDLASAMTDTAAGRPAAKPENAPDSAITVVSGFGGKTGVRASDVAHDACFSTAWTLSKRGVVTVNGDTPSRLSAARLVELCKSGDGKGAVILWTPIDRTAPAGAH